MALHKIPTADMTREEWLAERRNSIGGSEIGAILGLNSYQSAYSVWANKTGRKPDAEPNEAMRQGTDLEDYVAKRFEEVSGFKVQKQNYIVRNDDYPHIHANIDRRIVGQKAGLECKTASALSASKFSTGEFPLSYYAQCVTYMAIMGWSTWYLAAVVLGKDFKVYMLTTDENAVKPDWCESSVYVSADEFNAIRDEAIEFWKYVETDEEPPVDSSKATTDALFYAHSDADENAPDVDMFGTEYSFRRLAEIKEQIETLKAEQNGIENEIKQMLGDSTTGHNTQWIATWKPQTRRTFDAKAFAKKNPSIDLSPFYKETMTRVLKIKEVKQ